MTTDRTIEYLQGLLRELCALPGETEWVELVDNGFNVLVGSDFDKIIAASKSVHSMNKKFIVNLYGEGNASKVIVSALKNSGNDID